MSGKDDCEKLMNAVLPLADRMLSEYRKFHPYGGYMKASGEIDHTGAADKQEEHPKSKDLLYILRDSFSEMAATDICKATAIVFDVRVASPGTNDKSDAVQISLEHTDGYSAEVFLPYQIGQDGRVSYGTMFAQQGGHDIFSQQSSVRLRSTSGAKP